MLLLLGAYSWRKGNYYFIVSLLLRYTETLPCEFPKLESKKNNNNKKIGLHTEETLSRNKSNNLMIHIFPLFYCLASMKLCLYLAGKCASFALVIYV